MRTVALAHKHRTYLSGIAELASRMAEKGFLYERGSEDPSQPVLLAYSPLARMNAFQALLYRNGLQYGMAPVPVPSLWDLAELPWPGLTICHFHWIAGVVGDAVTEDEADERIGRFVELLAGLKRDGRRILWTAHNVLPHNSPMPEKDVELRKVLIGACDAVHIMTRNSVALISEHFPLDEAKTFHAPHPSYAGAYPDFVSREEARIELDVDGDDFVFLLFGSLQRYKGLTELLEAFGRLSAESGGPRVKLLIGGGASDAEFGREIVHWGMGRDDVYVRVGRIPNEDVQYLYRAADIAVLPYQRGLNSGSAMLALTFGVPVLAPASGGFTELVERFGGIAYDPADEDGLYNAMRSSLWLDRDRMRARIARQLPSRSPDAVSHAFFTGLVDRLGWPARQPRAEEPQRDRVVARG